MKFSRLAILLFLSAAGLVVNAEELTLAGAVNKLKNYYPSLKIAQIKAQQANLEIETIKSQLDWSLNGSVAMTHDVSAFSTPYDRFEAGGSVSRKLESGHTMGISGRYQYNDDSFVINNSFPNPSQSVNLDLSYRVPLGRGENNTIYNQSLMIADIQRNIEKLNEKSILKSLLEQVINLFYEIDNTEKRLNYTQLSINRSERLRDYISRNKQLGIYENKDVLQADAQLLKVKADRENLLLLLSEQKYALIKLLGISSDENITLKIEDAPVIGLSGDALLMAVVNDHPQLHIKKHLVEASDARIISALNENNDQKDIIFSIGARSLYGDANTDSVSEEDYAAQLKFEYKYDLGKRSYNAKIDKVKKEKDIALQEVALIESDIKYQLNALLYKINKQQDILNQLKKHKVISQEKYDDANQRYKKGRIDTTDLIKFESDLHSANLDYAAININLSRSRMNMALLSGMIWDMLALDIYGRTVK